jgi:hypothetical protein
MISCACGCGETFEPVGRQRFLNAAHRARAARARRGVVTGRDGHRDAEEAHRDGHRDGRDAEPELLEAEVPAAGSLAAAVERWLDGGDERIGEAVAATLRTLAVELDRDPKRSPLWARFLAAIELALEAEAAHKREAAEYHAALMTASAHAQAEWSRVRQALGDEEWERGARLAPISCAWGDHRWHRWPAGAIECEDCGVPGQQVADGILPAPGDWRSAVGLAGGGERP